MIDGIENKDKREEEKVIQIVCPICEKEQSLKISSSIIKANKHLTTISIPKGLICEHHFQAYIDKNYKVRGYQQVDFEFPLNKNENIDKYSKGEQKVIVNSTTIMKNDRNKNSVPKNNDRKEMSLKEVYEKYWDLIEDDSKTFQKFIKKDIRRKRKTF
ncbi:MAG: hypothetical protein R6U96_12510 [Promethearchaeia archaeon]